MRNASTRPVRIYQERLSGSSRLAVDSRKFKVAFITILPAPYQRDLFASIAKRPEIDLTVYYLVSKSVDNPWPPRPLQPYERMLSGVYINSRWSIAWGFFDDLKSFDFVVSAAHLSHPWWDNG